MFMEIFRFELRQQFKSPLFWIFLVLFFAGSLALVSSPAVAIGSAVGNVHVNAPVVIAQLGGSFAFLGTLFVVVFVAGALLRDFEQRTAETLFSTPVTRGAYLGGRFAAGFLVALIVVVAALLGALAGTLMPWVDAARLGPLMPSAWAWTFGVMVLPDMLFVAALLFALAAITRSLLAVFVGVVVAMVLRSIAGVLMGGLDHHLLAGLLDPYGAQALGAATRYWTAHAYNTQLPPLAGVLLGNRLLWLGAAVALFVAGFMMFRPDREGLRLRLWRRARGADTREPSANGTGSAIVPTVAQHYGWRAQWRQFVAMAVVDAAGVLRGVLFLVMLALGLAFLTALLFMGDQMYGTNVYPVTHLMVTDIGGAFSLFLYIVIAFYAGELVWRSRNAGANEVADALPTPEWAMLAAKAAALAAVVLAFLLAGMAWTIGFQLLNGYTHLEPGLYVSGLLLAAVPMVLIGMLALVLQVLANNKFLGYLLFVVYLVVSGVMGYFDLDHHLYQYAGAPGTPYSDMNGYGHFLRGALWFDAYWTLLAIALLALATLFWKRGTDSGGRRREACARLRRRPLQAVLAVSLAGFVASGAWIYYNTNVLNTYLPGDAAKQISADYEKLYAKYKDAPQPRIAAVKADVDIYPYQRRLHTHVHYRLVNRHDVPISELYVNWNQETPPTHLEFGAHETIVDDRRVGFSVYRLAQPLAPGASMDFDFDVDYTARGFRNREGGMDYLLVHNGTFFTNKALFPGFGYDAQNQLTEKKDRRKYGLKEDVPRMPPLGDEKARANTYIAGDADWVDFDTTISTAADQVALAPGQLQKTWEADGRRWFHYRSEAPILNFYAFLSGRWETRQARWNNVDIDVYYNPAHAWNVDDMIDSAKKSLDYYSTHFTPYQFRQLRIVEFPGYRSYAQSFAGTIPFSESVGFIADLKDKDDIDYPFYVTAHEVAHQWWAHQVIGANMQGSTLLSESLAQYSALMVMKHEYGEAQMRRFLKYELDKYLTGRITERVGENPLAEVEGQSYIRYNKASVVFYALQDYIGEDVVNAVLKGFLEAKGFQQPPYTTSKEFVQALKAGTDDKWDPLIDDLFWKITLFDDRVSEATATRRADGRYDVTLKLHAAKFHADDKGKQTQAAMDIPVDIGVFGRAADGKEADEKVLYLAKHTVKDGDSTLTVTVDGVPYEAGIDPYNKLVDRVSGDNRKKITLK